MLNHDYQVTIEHMILTNKLEVRLSTESWRDNNLVAELMFQHLRRNNIQKGFYDKEAIRIGDELDETIRTACTSSFLFIQLVTKDALAFHARNWPFKEYQLFKKYNDEMLKTHGRYQNVLKKRFLFALGGGQLSEVTPKGLRPFDYYDWYVHIDKLHHKAPPNDVKLFSQSIDDIAASVAAFVEGDWIQAI